jgi:hypothetical protein
MCRMEVMPFSTVSKYMGTLSFYNNVVIPPSHSPEGIMVALSSLRRRFGLPAMNWFKKNRLNQYTSRLRTALELVRSERPSMSSRCLSADDNYSCLEQRRIPTPLNRPITEFLLVTLGFDCLGFDAMSPSAIAEWLTFRPCLAARTGWN